jgi:hypothetical protein
MPASASTGELFSGPKISVSLTAAGKPSSVINGDGVALISACHPKN